VSKGVCLDKGNGGGAVLLEAAERAKKRAGPFSRVRGTRTRGGKEDVEMCRKRKKPQRYQHEQRTGKRGTQLLEMYMREQAVKVPKLQKKT